MSGSGRFRPVIRSDNQAQHRAALARFRDRPRIVQCTNETVANTSSGPDFPGNQTEQRGLMQGFLQRVDRLFNGDPTRLVPEAVPWMMGTSVLACIFAIYVTNQLLAASGYTRVPFLLYLFVLLVRAVRRMSDYYHHQWD